MSFSVMICRLCPLHLGHQALVDTMINESEGDYMLMIGSSNAELSYRHFFTYEERRRFVQTVYPEIKLLGLPDYQTNDEWFLALDDILRGMGKDPQSVTYYGGCDEDVMLFEEKGRSTRILNRFDGSSHHKISGTEIRDSLRKERSIKGMVDDRIYDDIVETFSRNWEILANK